MLLKTFYFVVLRVLLNGKKISFNLIVYFCFILLFLILILILFPLSSAKLR